MSLVENLINQITTQGLGGITKPQGFDMEDDTFSRLLEKGMNAYNNEIQPSNTIGHMGAPAGLLIEPLEGTEFAETVQDQMEIFGDNRLEKTNIATSPIEIKEIDMSDFFSNLVKTSSENHAEFMNFAKKQASNAYDVFRRTYVTDMQDFLEDITASS